jgi:ADP-ribose pyrophosphatase YjhB (NUDIX family)
VTVGRGGGAEEIPLRTSLVSVDVLAVRMADAEVRFATIERAADPYAGWDALPGVLLLEGERLAEAGRRALVSKAGLAPTAIGQLVVFDEPNRDPRGATLSAALWAVVSAGDAPPVTWRSFDDIGHLAFDHHDIVVRCRPILARLLWNDVDYTRALMGETFTVGEALGATTSLHGLTPDRGNLNKKLASVPGLVHAGHGTGRGRPSLWRWG